MQTPFSTFPTNAHIPGPTVNIYQKIASTVQQLHLLRQRNAVLGESQLPHLPGLPVSTLNELLQLFGADQGTPSAQTLLHRRQVQLEHVPHQEHHLMRHELPHHKRGLARVAPHIYNVPCQQLASSPLALTQQSLAEHVILARGVPAYDFRYGLSSGYQQHIDATDNSEDIVSTASTECETGWHLDFGSPLFEFAHGSERSGSKWAGASKLQDSNYATRALACSTQNPPRKRPGVDNSGDQGSDDMHSSTSSHGEHGAADQAPRPEKRRRHQGNPFFAPTP